MTTRTARERFTKAQASWRQTENQLEDWRLDVLLRRYGQHTPPASWLTYTERRTLERFMARMNRASDRAFTALDEHGGRYWRSHVPHSWVMRFLTWEDATTTGQLSVVPPPAYGYKTDDMERFAAPVELEVTR